MRSESIWRSPKLPIRPIELEMRSRRMSESLVEPLSISNSQFDELAIWLCFRLARE
ncbi:MAG: hypothetical protein WBA57_20225 [Elainellaceae cyanobacterium]